MIIEAASSDAASLRFANEIAKSLPKWSASPESTTRFFNALEHACSTYNLAWTHTRAILRSRADGNSTTDTALRIALDADSLANAKRDVFAVLGISHATDALLRDLHARVTR